MTGINQFSNSYALQLLSHQTGLSISASSANIGYNIGSAISIPRNGIVKITIVGHVSNGYGFIYLSLTRGSETYYLGGPSVSQSLFGNTYYNGINGGIYSNTPILLNYLISLNPNNITNSGSFNPFTLEILVLSGDTLQFFAGNNTGGNITYIDDMLVILQ